MFELALRFDCSASGAALQERFGVMLSKLCLTKTFNMSPSLRRAYQCISAQFNQHIGRQV
jgi:hypothetical protein